MRPRRQTGRMNIHQQVVRELAVRILSGVLRPGDILPTEDNASTEMDVSRTAYREAIKVLSAKGLLESRAKVGTRVRQKSEWNMLDPEILGWKSEIETPSKFVDDLFEFRMIIEPAAARLAARKGSPEKIDKIRHAFETMANTEMSSVENFEADFDFHKSILEASENELLSSLGHVVETLLLTSFELSALRPGAREQSVPLHGAVLAQIQNRDQDKARDAMTTLLASARTDLDDVLQNDIHETTILKKADPDDTSTRAGGNRSPN